MDRSHWPPPRRHCPQKPRSPLSESRAGPWNRDLGIAPEPDTGNPPQPQQPGPRKREAWSFPGKGLEAANAGDLPPRG